MSNNWKIVYIWTINYDSLNKNTISLKLHKGTAKLLIIEFNFFGEEITILVHIFVQVLLTILAYKYCDHNVQDTHLLHSTLRSWINFEELKLKIHKITVVLWLLRARLKELKFLNFVKLTLKLNGGVLSATSGYLEHYDRHTCMQVLSTILVQKSEQVLLFLPQRS
jgi:hypothetical protein